MTTTDRNMNEFLEILKGFDEAMLVTVRGSQLRSRPMSIADCTEDGRVRFITRDDSGKLDELDENSSVNLAMQADSRFLSISGVARLTKDRTLIDKVWERKQKPWFHEGRDDPHVILLEVFPACVEYWDRSAENPFARVLDEIFGRVRDDTDPADEPGVHGRVDFSDQQDRQKTVS